jgi:hypothetical protein
MNEGLEVGVDRMETGDPCVEALRTTAVALEFDLAGLRGIRDAQVVTGALFVSVLLAATTIAIAIAIAVAVAITVTTIAITVTIIAACAGGSCVGGEGRRAGRSR